MDQESSDQVQSALDTFERELARLEVERAQIIADYTRFLEAKRIELVMKNIAAR
jgi:hypothetical protein